ncbi:hypothetical protein ACOMHN_045385 [Nucella lapillus]
MAKETVLQNHYPRESTKKLYKLLFEFHKESFPNLLVLANLALTMPLQTADCCNLTTVNQSSCDNFRLQPVNQSPCDNFRLQPDGEPVSL